MRIFYIIGNFHLECRDRRLCSPENVFYIIKTDVKCCRGRRPRRPVKNKIKKHNYNEIYSIPRRHYVLKEIVKLISYIAGEGAKTLDFNIFLLYK